jgi:hypothetical protein
MLLTAEQLRELTDRARARDQVEWLRARGWAFSVGVSGRPKVDIEEYRKHMISGSAGRTPRTPQPDLSWFDGPTQKA